MTHPSPIVLGIFVGGKGSRMGGANKALLRAPGGAESLVERMARVGREANLDVVIVGQGDVGHSLETLERLHDDPPGTGPLGAMGALLACAQRRNTLAIAVGCDMPYVSAALLQRLADTPSQAAVLAARAADSGKWEPLFARYEPTKVLPALRRVAVSEYRSLQGVIVQAGVEELELTSEERAQLRDWDNPEDVHG